RTVGALAPGGQAQGDALLDAGLEAGALVVSGTRYRFRHELVRQARIEGVPPHRRLRAHRETAQRLAAAGAPPSVIAYQWLAGGSPAQAAPFLLAAAWDAARLASFGEVLRHLEPLLAFEPGHPDALRLRAEALEATGDPAA